MKNLVTNKWAQFDIYALSLSILILLVLVLDLNIEIIWSLIIFIAPFFVIMSFVNLFAGSVAVFLLKNRIPKYFLTLKIIFFVVSNGLVICMGNCLGKLNEIEIHIISVLLMFVVLGYLISIKLKAILIVFILSLYIHPKGLSVVGLDVGSIDVARLYMVFALFFISVPTHEEIKESK